MRSSWLMTPATSLSTPGLLRLARDLVKVSLVVVRLSVRTERGRSEITGRYSVMAPSQHWLLSWLLLSSCSVYR